MAEITNFRGEAETIATTGPEAAVASLMTRVGERVRKVRESRNISRRILSESSGVSARYLAQLEAGEGNISIALLQRVALALDIRIDWLVGEEDPWTSDAMRVADLFARADRDVQEKVLTTLFPEANSDLRARRICLIGLRGAGKSTLGQRAGEHLGVPFLELNNEIEDHAGMAVEEVMALYGQEGYRKLEAQAVQRIIESHDTVILAVAGGIVAEPVTFSQVLNSFHTIWVKATPEDHMSRVRAQGDMRPMAGNPEAMDQLKSILASREALYQRAAAELDTTGQTIAQSLDDLLGLIGTQKILG